MSNFPGDRFAYNNPLISTFNPWDTKFSPNNDYQLSPAESARASSTLTIPMRVKALYLLKEYIQRGDKGDRDIWRAENDWQFTTPAQNDLKWMAYQYKIFNTVESSMKISVNSDVKNVNKFLSENGANWKINMMGEGMAVSIVNNFWYNFMFPPTGGKEIKTNYGRFKAFTFPRSTNPFPLGHRRPENISGYQILEAKNNFHLHLIKIRTADPEISIYIRMAVPSYNEQTDPYAMKFEWDNWRRERNFYRDITRNYTSLTVPELATQLAENTQHIEGMCLSTWNNATGLKQKYKISRFIQITKLYLNASGFGSRSILSVTQPKGKEGYPRQLMNTDYQINRPFTMWMEHEQISHYPLSIGFYNFDTWVKK